MKLKAIVEIAIEKGWVIITPDHEVCYGAKYTLEGAVPTVVILCNSYMVDSKRPEKGIAWEDKYHYTASEILFNHELMKAAVAGKCTHFVGVDCTAERTCTFSDSCETCGNYAPVGAMLEAAKLPTDADRIDYVYNIIKGEIK